MSYMATGPLEGNVLKEEGAYSYDKPFYWEYLVEDNGNLDELDDEELDSYINTNEEEIELHTRLWDTINAEYLEEMALRERQIALGIIKPRPTGTDRKRKVKVEASSALQAASAALSKKSTKVNYRALESLFSSMPNEFEDDGSGGEDDMFS
eukprot:TRINITY_DN5871_c0_g2_i2.p1 TRINITY_DN5871_c0_g2~~TRINITY_DN5871_c0_g2_i2.p1  ORF type:complete len:152 (-),score=38.37 TRINITY_DN5871_c0_g2_i2:49-504(-)